MEVTEKKCQVNIKSKKMFSTEEATSSKRTVELCLVSSAGMERVVGAML